MGKNFLATARDDWRKICAGLNQNSYQYFLDNVGERAEYKHIALDSYSLNGKLEYGTQLFAVFKHKDNRFVFTITDLEALANYAKSHKSPSVRRHMTQQLALASRDYDANQGVIADLSPYKNRPRRVFAR